MVPLLLVFLVNSLALVFSVYFYIVGPVELRWIFAVWSITSSILLYFIVKTYLKTRRDKMRKRWILGPGILTSNSSKRVRDFFGPYH